MFRTMGSRSQNLVLPEGTSTLIRSLINERTGMFFDNGKSDLLIDKLSPLVIERGFSSYLDYYYLLKYDASARAEWQNVMNALSVQETYFWREFDQIRALVQTLLPQWQARKTGATLRIWCAACATGEEPLTIAMALNEAGWLGRAPIEIRASDASTAAVGKARRGVYRERSFRNLPAHLRDRYFTQEGATKTWRVDTNLHTAIDWRVANLMKEGEVAPLAAANVIFCRNVFIYFSDQTIGKTVRAFAANIRPPGYLFVAAAESLLKLTTEFELREVGGAFVYVRRPG